MIETLSFKEYSEPPKMNFLFKNFTKFVVKRTSQRWLLQEVNRKEHLVHLFQLIGIKIWMEATKKILLHFYFNWIKRQCLKSKMTKKLMQFINLKIALILEQALTFKYLINATLIIIAIQIWATLFICLMEWIKIVSWLKAI